jgi:hypothetical protein
MKGDTMYGIEETKEVLVASNELGLVIAKHVKDGAQVTDIAAIAMELFGSDAFKAALVKAIENVKQVPAEVKDIDIGEGLELAKVQLSYVPKFLDVLKK